MDEFVRKHSEIAALEGQRDALHEQERFYHENEKLVNGHIVAGRQKRSALFGYLLLFIVEAWVGFELASLPARNNARHFAGDPIEHRSD